MKDQQRRKRERAAWLVCCLPLALLPEPDEDSFFAQNDNILSLQKTSGSNACSFTTREVARKGRTFGAKRQDAPNFAAVCIKTCLFTEGAQHEDMLGITMNRT
ncbi:hypothetical protein V5799_011836 [Amblyomma americanum]|uniref:Secreted protein n=1 Tax=Amblyomma americanum TaxID=6943 RepID=A0AAQ4EG34_AMBAM